MRMLWQKICQCWSGKNLETMQTPIKKTKGSNIWLTYTLIWNIMQQDEFIPLYLERFP